MPGGGIKSAMEINKSNKLGIVASKKLKFSVGSLNR
jgi:hypothetical protein